MGKTSPLFLDFLLSEERVSVHEYDLVTHQDRDRGKKKRTGSVQLSMFYLPCRVPHEPVSKALPAQAEWSEQMDYPKYLQVIVHNCANLHSTGENFGAKNQLTNIRIPGVKMKTPIYVENN